MTRALLLENPHAIADEIFAKFGIEVTRVTGALSEDDLIDALEGVDYLGLRSKTEVTERVLRARPDLGWDLGETGGTIGVRMPDQPALLALLRTFGPMAVTSANLTGEPPATSITAAVSSFGSCVAAYLDAGPTESATASSIVSRRPAWSRAW